MNDIQRRDPSESDTQPTKASHELGVAGYFSACRLGGEIDISKFLPPRESDQYFSILRRILLAEISRQVDVNHEIVDGYLKRFPDIVSQTDWAWELLAVEYYARLDRGETVNLLSYQKRFPDLYESLVDQLEKPSDSRTVKSGATNTDVFRPGTVLDDFEIIQQIGQGGQASVYQVRQLSLDRQLALKISDATGHEGQTLARLEHPNIVTVYSERIFAGRKLLAMRLIDGRSLTELIQYRRNQNPQSFGRSELLAWLKKENDPSPVQVTEMQRQRGIRHGPAATMIRLIRDVARGLAHAHSKYVLHCDIKPANILLDRAGVALLTDFNVAALQDNKSDSEISSLGGTPAYMSPEHIRAMAFWLDDHDNEFDERSDIYSLGTVFYELITGHHPWTISHAEWEPSKVNQILAERLQEPRLFSENIPGVNSGLRAIIIKCLTSQPSSRYQNALQLIEDLDRWLTFRPLVYAKHNNWPEKICDCARRHPTAISVAAMVFLAAGLIIGILIGGSVTRLRRAERLLDQCTQEMAKGNVQTVISRVGEARGVLADRIPPAIVWMFTDRIKTTDNRLRNFETDLALIEKRQFDQAVLATRTTELSGSKDSSQVGPLQNPLSIYRVLENPDWESSPRFQSLSAVQQNRVYEDITEILLIVLSDISRNPKKYKDQLQKLLDRFPKPHQKLPLIENVIRSRGKHLANAILTNFPINEFENYLLATMAAYDRQYEIAIQHLEKRSAQLSSNQPSRFWADFLMALCCQNLNRSEEAIEHYGKCIGQNPDFAWPYYNLGLIYAELDRLKPADRLHLAERHLSKAIKIDSEFTAAYASLGAVLYLQDRPRDALKHFSRAIGQGHQNSQTYANQAAAFHAIGNVSDAVESLQQALRLDSNNDQLQQRLKAWQKNQ